MNEAPAKLSSYVWQAPGKRLSVSLSLEVVDLLGFAVMEGFQSLPRRGLEVGGFLLGRTRKGGEGVVVEVDRFEPLECEHVVGPSYLLSRADREALEARLRSHKSGSGLSIVGFYRSHTRKEFALTMEDLDLMSDYFSKPSMVFLLIHMQRGGPPMAAFSIWEGRKGLSMTPSSPFPFRRTVLTSGEYAICDRSSGLRPASEKPGAPQSSPAAAGMEPSESPARRLPRVPEVPPALPRPVPAPPQQIAAAASPGPQDPTHPQSPQPRNDALSRFLLQARKQSKSGWTFAASILLAGLFAGVLHRSAVPAESDRPAPSAAGALPEAPPVPVASQAPVAPLETKVPERVAPAPVSAAARVANPGETRNRTRSYREPEESTPAVIPAARPKPAAVSTSAEPPVLPNPPDVATGLPGGDGLSRWNEILKPRIPQINDPFVSVTVDSVPRSNGSGLLRKLPLIGKRHKRVEQADYTPPKPVREAPTVISPELRQSIQHEIPIDVKVYVDRAGKVEFAELLSEGTRSNRDVATLAVFAARRWEFLPAREGDETVAAEVVLRFRFGPQIH